MSLTSDLQTHLLSKSAITDLVGASGVYWMMAPQGTAYPYIVMSLVSGVPMAPDLTNNAGLQAANYQLTVSGEPGDDVDAIAETVRNDLEDFSGTMGGTTIQSCGKTSQREIHIPSVDGEQFGVDRIILEYEIWHAESLPVST